MEETVLDFGEENSAPRPAPKSRHPFVCVVHLLFRTAAVLTYLLCGIFGVGFVTAFIVIILLLSADFWCVKNVTGRLLVGLRWINRVHDDGTSVWEYESHPNKTPTNFESRLFWIGLIVFPVAWVFMFFSTVFSFHIQWVAVVVVALVLNSANLFGYVRCKFSSRKEMGSAATRYFGGKLFQSFQSNPDLVAAATSTAAASS